MKLVVSFYGMCLCVLDGRRGNRAAGATVLLLNGAARSTRSARPGIATRLPYHHPLLFVPARNADVTRTAWSPVPAPEALVDTENLISGRCFAWNLAGLDLTLGRGRGLTMFENQRADESGRLPDPSSNADTKAYLDWRRIPDLTRIVPGAKVRAGFKAIGANVLGMIRFTGGELRGAKPKNAAASAVPWHFSPSFEQVITDRFEIHCDLPGAEIKGQGFAGGRPQAIRMTGADDKVIRLVVVHEASIGADDGGDRRRRDLSSGAASLPHYTAFYDAIQGPGVEALAPPRPAGPGLQGPVPVIHDPNCPAALI